MLYKNNIYAVYLLGKNNKICKTWLDIRML